MSKVNWKQSFSTSSAAKKPKFREEDEEKPSSFESELAIMDLVDDDFPDETLLIGQGPEQENTFAKWSKTSLSPLNPQADTLAFQQIEIDHYIGKSLPGMPGSKIGPVPMRKYGVMKIVCYHIYGFCPYLFVSVSSNFTNNHCRPFKEALNQVVKKDVKSNPDNIQDSSHSSSQIGLRTINVWIWRK